MSTKAFIFIETSVGKTREIANTLKGVNGIQSADLVTGPYDVIVVIEAEDINAVGRLVEQRIHALSGVMRTVTCVAIGT
ncbi:MAG: Lrp/AsnC ligand binding domain-containing protein [Dehalococcoidia bacterium]|nr:Lrp/AsnC ligand binding domain-containing protein [Dehalococcoidia bacterium]